MEIPEVCTDPETPATLCATTHYALISFHNKDYIDLLEGPIYILGDCWNGWSLIAPPSMTVAIHVKSCFSY